MSVTRLRKWKERHPAYATWRAMMMNCGISRRPASESARKYYEDRGVTVCDEWRDFHKYEQWLLGTGWKHKSGMFVARKDKYGDFCPENCVVVSKTGCENMRSNVFRIGGKSIRDILGDVPEGRNNRIMNVRQRISIYKWTVEDAFSRGTTPRNMLNRLHLKKGKTDADGR